MSNEYGYFSLGAILLVLIWIYYEIKIRKVIKNLGDDANRMYQKHIVDKNRELINNITIFYLILLLLPIIFDFRFTPSLYVMYILLYLFSVTLLSLTSIKIFKEIFFLSNSINCIYTKLCFIKILSMLYLNFFMLYIIMN